MVAPVTPVARFWRNILVRIILIAALVVAIILGFDIGRWIVAAVALLITGHTIVGLIGYASITQRAHERNRQHGNARNNRQ